MDEQKERAVIVTTAHRGVFYGYTTQEAERVCERKIATLRRARCVVYWPADNKGFLGLALHGPKKGSRVGPPADSLTLADVTSIADCADGTAHIWEDQPWAR